MFWIAVNSQRLDWNDALLLSGTFAGTLAYYVLIHRFVGKHDVSWGARKATSILPATAFFVGHVSGIVYIQLGIVAFFGVSLVVQAKSRGRDAWIRTPYGLCLKLGLRFGQPERQ